MALLAQSPRAVRILAGMSPVSSHGPLKVSLLVDTVVPGSTAIRNGTCQFLRLACGHAFWHPSLFRLLRLCWFNMSPIAWFDADAELHLSTPVQCALNRHAGSMLAACTARIAS